MVDVYLVGFVLIAFTDEFFFLAECERCLR